MKEFMDKEFKSSLVILGLGPGEEHEGKFLKRLTRVDEGGWEFEADSRYVTNLLAMHGLKK